MSTNPTGPGTATFRYTAKLSHRAGVALRDGQATAARRRVARETFEIALRELLRWEDRGHDTAHADRVLTAARHRATAAGLLTAEDVSRIESAVVAAA